MNLFICVVNGYYPSTWFVLEIYPGEREKLSGSNFLDWERNLRNVLKHEMREHVIDQPIPLRLDVGSMRSDRDAHFKHLIDSLEVGSVMLSAMEADLRELMTSGESFAILEQLKKVFKGRARTERFVSVKGLMSA